MCKCYYCNNPASLMRTYTKIPICSECAKLQFDEMVERDPTYRGTFHKYHCEIDDTVRSKEEIDEYLAQVEEGLKEFMSH